MYRIDTIQQVLAELLFLYHLLQVPVRGADQADIDGDRGIATYPYDAPALQGDRKSTRLNSSQESPYRMPSPA